MKTGFTNSMLKLSVSLCILCFASIRGMQAKNGTTQSTNSQPGEFSISAPVSNVRISIDPASVPGKVLLGNIILSLPQDQSYSIVIQMDPQTDPQSLQFNVNQQDLNDLYKLLELYKSESNSGKGHGVVILTRKNKLGNKAIDSSGLIFKYVVADDIAGYTPISPSTSPNPNENQTIGDNSGGSGSDLNNLIPNVTKMKVFSVANVNVPAGTITLYPNPSRDIITISLDELPGANITVYDLQGRLVKSIIPSFGIHEQKMDISDLPSGIYIVNVVSTNGVQAVKKFSKIN